MRSLTPLLLEIRARGRAARGDSRAALFSLAAADHLRETLPAPRSAEEQSERDALDAALQTALGAEDARALRVRASALSLEEIAAETSKE